MFFIQVVVTTPIAATESVQMEDAYDAAGERGRMTEVHNFDFKYTRK